MDENEPGTFDFDVFLSHSSKDKPVVRPLAERLRVSGLKVWFDEWEIKLGDPIYAKVNAGLERSRILLLFMSENGFGSDWVNLEHQAILFADPMNRERRFIPLLLTKCTVPPVLRQFKLLDWQTPSDAKYQDLLLACQAAVPLIGSAEPGPASNEPRTSSGRQSPEDGLSPQILNGHSDWVRGVAVTADGRRAVSGANDHTVRVWDLESATCTAVLEGHEGGVSGVAVTADGRRAVSGADDFTVRVWDLTELSEAGARPQGQTMYTNAKVLLTGDNGAGKTGLAQRLAHRSFEASYSTDGVWATQLPLGEDAPAPQGVEREIWLWDFAGQADYRLIHQLYMDGTDLALLVFDPQKDNPFEGLAQWDQDPGL